MSFVRICVRIFADGISFGFPYTSPTPETAAKGAGFCLLFLCGEKQN